MQHLSDRLWRPLWLHSVPVQHSGIHLRGSCECNALLSARNLTPSLFYKEATQGPVERNTNRVGKCRGYGGYIRVKFLETLGKFFESNIRTYDVA